jgi:fructokinase
MGAWVNSVSLTIMSETQTNSNLLRPLILGEVLFDHFPNGEKILGGAPFNVAWNLRGMGANPRIITAVGDDAEGKEILKKMASWQLSDEAVEINSERPTGKVTVSDPAGEPTYEIALGQAWDYLSYADKGANLDEFGIFYHGSLAYRGEKTRRTMDKLRSESKLPVFLDLNIREPWFEASWLPALLDGVSWLKLNRDELQQVSGLSDDKESRLVEQSQRTMDAYGIENLLITDGSVGAHYFGANGEHIFCEAPKVENFVDSVGAGDAFASVCIMGVLKGWIPKVMLEKAAEFAAQVCSRRGATSGNADDYKEVGG